MVVTGICDSHGGHIHTVFVLSSFELSHHHHVREFRRRLPPPTSESARRRRFLLRVRYFCAQSKHPATLLSLTPQFNGQLDAIERGRVTFPEPCQRASVPFHLTSPLSVEELSLWLVTGGPRPETAAAGHRSRDPLREMNGGGNGGGARTRQDPFLSV